jgi:hypothetical protein
VLTEFEHAPARPFPSYDLYACGCCCPRVSYHRPMLTLNPNYFTRPTSHAQNALTCVCSTACCAQLSTESMLRWRRWLQPPPPPYPAPRLELGPFRRSLQRHRLLAAASRAAAVSSAASLSAAAFLHSPSSLSGRPVRGPHAGLPLSTLKLLKAPTHQASLKAPLIELPS